MLISSQKLGLCRWLVLHGAKLMPVGNTLGHFTWVLVAPNATTDRSLEPPLCFTAGSLPVSQPQPPKPPPLPPSPQGGCRAGTPWALTPIPAACTWPKSPGSPGRRPHHHTSTGRETPKLLSAPMQLDGTKLNLKAGDKTLNGNRKGFFFPFSLKRVKTNCFL